MRTHNTRHVCSECILNYKIALEKINGSPVQIIFPSEFANIADKINRKRPGTINIQPINDEEFEDQELKGSSWEDYYTDDLAPEGMSLDEVDWDSFNWDDD